MDTYIAALDQGTTSSRAILFHETGEIAARAQYPFRQIYPQPGWVEHDPMEIWASERRALAEITSHIDPRQVAAIGITMGQIRLSSGLEDTDDLLNDFDQALAKM